MPELPEVETIKRGLLTRILNKRIMRIVVLNEKSWRGLPSERIVGESIVAIERRGKALLLRMSNGLYVMVHLRMTGQIIVDEGESGEEAARFAAGHPDESFREKMPGRHTRVVIEFEDGVRLYFNDLRKFGFMKVLDELGVQEERFLRKLGPEPWEMTEDDFWERLQRHRTAPVKAVILNQEVIAGVGNIYADEGCFVARIYPGVRCGELTREEADKLLEGLREVMQASIDSGGSTMKDYVKADGTRGDYLEKFAQVFRRNGKSCRECGAEILKTRVAGRGTHYCPRCQRGAEC
ncbi:bifunctional DNA-formamidopyrimidine glycosylase/DNA-(apurinic or apyrimidinic site) lyase [Candidatus Saccharibacteria bacterium]|nr:bifunctional DNA-formamidopyrimidine glycosylase/DNA-(apurinic or apyrimidinic site) lyase [Candidatus Saccharibacteria bacterium]